MSDLSDFKRRIYEPEIARLQSDRAAARTQVAAMQAVLKKVHVPTSMCVHTCDNPYVCRALYDLARAALSSAEDATEPLYTWGANTTGYGPSWAVFDRRGEIVALCNLVLPCHRIVAALNEFGPRPVPGSIPAYEAPSSADRPATNVAGEQSDG